MRGRILIADDEREMVNALAEFLQSEGLHCETALDGEKALELIQNSSFDIILLDIKMPGRNGMELLRYCQDMSPRTMVIMITAYATVETAIQALRQGAVDYITKPLDFDELLIRVKNVLRQRKILLENIFLKKELHERYDFEGIIGESPAMQQVFEMVKRVSASSSNILITGKSGTGKELIARAIHNHSPRAKEPFVPINCGAIPENLFESELFGFKKGAFTGAHQDKDGVFRGAHGGTLFLDEVGEIPIHVQVKLLRAIETKEIKPLGSNSYIPVDVRILSATNKDLKKEVEEGNFREDLYYRLNIVEIKLPSLQERREDIPLLANYFIRKYNERLNRRILGLDEKAIQILLNHVWKGEVRELENMIERAVLLAEGEYITPRDLPATLTESSTNIYPDDLKQAVKNFERNHIISILKRTGYDKNKAARLLNIGLSSLYRKIDELNIKL